MGVARRAACGEGGASISEKEEGAKEWHSETGPSSGSHQGLIAGGQSCLGVAEAFAPKRGPLGLREPFCGEAPRPSLPLQEHGTLPGEHPSSGTAGAHEEGQRRAGRGAGQDDGQPAPSPERAGAERGAASGGETGAFLASARRQGPPGWRLWLVEGQAVGTRTGCIGLAVVPPGGTASDLRPPMFGTRLGPCRRLSGGREGRETLPWEKASGTPRSGLESRTRSQSQVPPCS